MSSLKSLLIETSKKSKNYKVLIKKKKIIYISDLIQPNNTHLNQISEGDVVALIGDFDKLTIQNFINLIDKKAIIVPLTKETKKDHKKYLKVSQVDFVVNRKKVISLKKSKVKRGIIKQIQKKCPGIIFFSTGTSGEPKAILHKFPNFIDRYRYKKNKRFKTLSFLLFDHIGGIHTFLFTLFNGGTLIIPENRSVDHILTICKKYSVEVLPATPTFLKILLLRKDINKIMPRCIKIITYATEIMDSNTLLNLCKKFPKIDFRQKYGMSEIGIFRVISKSRCSNFFRIVDKNFKIKIQKSILFIKSKYRMLGYLNSPTGIDKSGWYKTNDLVEKKGKFIKIIGRNDKVINVGGLKVLPAFIEEKINSFDNVLHCQVYGRPNPFTGQHVEAIIEPKNFKKFNLTKLNNFIKKNLQSYMRPQKVELKKVKISHRQKKIFYAH